MMTLGGVARHMTEPDVAQGVPELYGRVASFADSLAGMTALQ
jgi:hypothetical protein